MRLAAKSPRHNRNVKETREKLCESPLWASPIIQTVAKHRESKSFFFANGHTGWKGGRNRINN